MGAYRRKDFMAVFAIYQTVANWDGSSRCSSSVPEVMAGSYSVCAQWQGHWSPCWSHPTLCFGCYSRQSGLPSLILWPSQEVCKAFDIL